MCASHFLFGYVSACRKFLIASYYWETWVLHPVKQCWYYIFQMLEIDPWGNHAKRMILLPLIFVWLYASFRGINFSLSLQQPAICSLYLYCRQVFSTYFTYVLFFSLIHGWESPAYPTPLLVYDWLFKANVGSENLCCSFHFIMFKWRCLLSIICGILWSLATAGDSFHQI